MPPTVRQPPRWIIEHTAQYESDPRQAHDWDATRVGIPGIVPTLLLTTVGRRTGKKRSIPLLYQPAGHGYVIVASKGGAPTHPAWYLNLLVTPDCEIRVATLRYDARAQTLTGDARQRYWNLLARVAPPYQDYQAATDREIPVVLLRPAATG